MKKLVLTVFVSVLFTFGCKCQCTLDEFNRVEIEYGQFHSIRIVPGGILCKTCNANLKSKIKFFRFSKVNPEAFSKLQQYVVENLIFSKDTIINYPGIVTSTNSIEIVIIDNKKNIHKIKWIDGKCEELEKLIEYMNAEFKLQMQLFCFSKLIIISDVESNIRNAFWDGDLVCIESRICLHQ